MEGVYAEGVCVEGAGDLAEAGRRDRAPCWRPRSIARAGGADQGACLGTHCELCVSFV